MGLNCSVINVKQKNVFNHCLIKNLAKQAIQLVFRYFKKPPRYPKNTFANYQYLNTSKH